ncbi:MULTISPECIES: WXG100 family type VII secretion target [unclassified Kitasatospora]|uniref:WXG100 family type VII secretion target n=1 Tax=unclassified Kitasatospora TaxID=2633591 RepID=UPI000AC5B884|nr:MULTISPECIES: WXG100 family type VII secretion target [unclassified Kitasatospora]
MSEYTNFNGYSHGDLRRMVGGMDSGGIMSAADPWRRASDTLKQIRTALTTASSDAVTTWEGATSEAFHTKMTKLATSINNVAAYANDAAVTLELMSGAIDEAKRTMPEEPGFWSKAADAVGDTAASAAGTDNEDTRTAVTDEKKAQAVAVMNLLATRYRTATDYLKPPSRGRIEDWDSIPAPDSSGPAAFSSLIMGAGVGFAGANSSSGAAVQSRSTSSVGATGSQPPKKFQPSGPTDPGIKGGTANPLPKPQSPGSFGPGTGIDGVVAGTKPTGNAPRSSGGYNGGPGTGAGSGSNLGGTGVIGGSSGGTPKGSGGFSGARSAADSDLRRAPAGSAGRGSGAFGASGMPGAGAGGSAAGGATGGAGSSAARRAGGTAGAVGSGGTGRGSFTEGGSGLGRGRAQAGQTGGAAGGGMPGAAQPGKKDKDKNGKSRPDYLVEDEDTWAVGQPTNPNVVE